MSSSQYKELPRGLRGSAMFGSGSELAKSPCARFPGPFHVSNNYLAVHIQAIYTSDCKMALLPFEEKVT